MSVPQKLNIFKAYYPDKELNELVEELLKTDTLLIERIISHGHITPEGEWYDQEKDEWVILLSGNATIKFDNGILLNMNTGDYILIPAHCRHRVEMTSKNPVCTWLAVHGKFSPGSG